MIEKKILRSVSNVDRRMKIHRAFTVVSHHRTALIEHVNRWTFLYDRSAYSLFNLKVDRHGS